MADIANLTRHQTIQDAILTSMGETIALQQGLQNIENYDGKNMPLKNFIEDVESGLELVPAGLHETFFKCILSKLKDTARDAVVGKEIRNINQLKDALKQYFSPKKSYSAYCSDLNHCRMRKGESVLEFFARLKKLVDGATAALSEKFNDAQVATMKEMVTGMALESFKRGLSDDLAYAVTISEPNTLEDAMKVAQRIENVMRNENNHRANIHVIGEGAQSAEASVSAAPVATLLKGEEATQRKIWEKPKEPQKKLMKCGVEMILGAEIN